MQEQKKKRDISATDFKSAWSLKPSEMIYKHPVPNFAHGWKVRVESQLHDGVNEKRKDGYFGQI